MIVVKVGGRALEANMDNILSDIASIAGSYRVILVHGGGDKVTEYSRRLGIEPRIVTHPSGVRSRYTTREELEVYTMVMAGLINKAIVSRLNHMGVPAIGVSGADLGLLRGERRKRIIIVNERGRPQAVPGGYTGKITSINVDAVNHLLGHAKVLVVTPLILGMEGELLNVDGDQAASAVATAVGGEALIMLSDVEGVIVEGRVIERLTVEEAKDLARRVGKGMNRKLLMAVEALEKGVRKVVIASGLGREPVSRALTGSGTIIE